MTYGTRTDHYPASSKVLHWLVAVCVLMTAPVAIAMTRIGEGPTREPLQITWRVDPHSHDSPASQSACRGRAGPRGGDRALAKSGFVDRAHLFVRTAARHACCRLHRQFRLRRQHALLRFVRAAGNRG
jgi:hypothetical protein